MASKILTSDKLPFMALIFGFIAGLLVIFSLLLIGQLFSTFQRLSRGAPEFATQCDYSSYPAVCEEYNVKEKAWQRAGLGLFLLILAGVAWAIGFRYRTVAIKEGRVIFGWGEFLPISYASLPAKELNNFTITREQRFTVTPGPGNTQRVGRAPDRWRLKATYGKRKINLGSYTSEQEAQNALQNIKQT